MVISSVVHNLRLFNCQRLSTYILVKTELFRSEQRINIGTALQQVS